MSIIRNTYFGAIAFLFLCVALIFSTSAQGLRAAPYSAVVMDASDGTVIYSRDGNAILHPASLTKMMTLYIAFSEVQSGRMRLDQRIPISSNAAAQPPSKIGLKAGSSMELRYLLRAAAIKSANDAATAIAEGVAGSEANFAQYMTQVARGLGMRNTVFKNPHGLTSNGHYSTAYDMAILGRHLIYDFPEFYSLFSRQYAETPLGNFKNSNVRFLKDYPGADGIKTGYTKAAGYNLVGTAKRGNARVIVSMFGGQSSYQRNEQIGALLDLGFRQAKPATRISNLGRVRLNGPATRMAAAAPAPQHAPKPAPQPAAQPVPQPVAQPVPQQVATAPAPQPARPQYTPPQASVVPPSRVVVSSATGAVDQAALAIAADLASGASTPAARPEQTNVSSASMLRIPASRPGKLNTGVQFPKVDEKIVASNDAAGETDVEVAKVASDGDYAVQLGARPSKSEAQSYLEEAKGEAKALEGVKNQVISVKLNGAKMYRPRFSGMSKKSAYEACSKFQARNEQCYVIAPADG